MLRGLVLLVVLGLLVGSVWGQDVDDGIVVCSVEELAEGLPIMEVAVRGYDLVRDDVLAAQTVTEMGRAAGFATATYDEWMTEFRPDVPFCQEFVIMMMNMDEAFARMSMAAFLTSFNIPDGQDYFDEADKRHSMVEIAVLAYGTVSDDGS